MTTKLKSLITIAGCSLLMVGCATMHNPTKWEYKAVLAPQSSTDTKAWLESQQAFLNELGEEGWILVAVDKTDTLYLKRAKR